MTSGNGGPYIQAAAFCETIIRGAETGRLSLMNIVDGLTVVGPIRQHATDQPGES